MKFPKIKFCIGSDSAYVVTSGEYDDYRIEGIFDSRGLAEDFLGKFIEKRGESWDAVIEHRELNPVFGK